MSTAIAHREGARSTEFRRDIQGMRALAVILVVIFHSGFALRGGFIGVDVFFVISGFLIIGLLDREAERTGRINLPAFFVRRARRLLPALAATISATVLVSIAVVEVGAPLRAVARTAMGASIFAANFVLYRNEGDYFAASTELNPLLHTWSLSVEEQFYFLVPITLAVAIAVRNRWPASVSRRRIWAVILVAGALVSFALNVFLVDIGGRVLSIDQGVRFAFYAPVTRAWQFALGGLLALLVAAGRLPRRLGAPGVVPLGLVLILGSALLFDEGVGFPGVRAATPTLGTLLALAPGSLGGIQTVGFVRRSLSTKPVVFVGDLSYSWYLWHWPAIVLARATFGGGAVVILGAVAASFLLGIVSKRYIEDRYRFNRGLVSAQVARLGLVCIAVPFLSGFSLWAANGWSVDRYDLGLENRSWVYERCNDNPGEWRPDECGRGQSLSGRPGVDVLLVGDSHAAVLGDGVLAAVERLGLSVGAWTFSSEPPIGREGSVERNLALIELTKPSVVVVATRSNYYARRAGLSVWAEELAQAVGEYRAMGPRVIWVHNVPEFPQSEGGVLLEGTTLVSRGRHRAISLEELAGQRGEVLAVEREVLTGLEGVFALDPADALCELTCSNGADGQFYYFDDNHLSSTGSRLLTDLLERALADAH